MDSPADVCPGGRTGEVDLKELGVDGAGAVKKGVHATLSRCLHTLNLFKSIKMFHDGVLPPREVLPSCAHRKFRLLFVLEKTSDYYKGRQVQCSLHRVCVRLPESNASNTTCFPMCISPRPCMLNTVSDDESCKRTRSPNGAYHQTC